MSRKIINIGQRSNDGTGDSIRDAFNKANKNFTELYSISHLEQGLYFTSNLNDTPKQLIQNGILTTDISVASTITQKTLVGRGGIDIEFSGTNIVFNTTQTSISLDPNPTLNANLQGNTYQAKNFAAPTDLGDLTTKGYVDNTTVSVSGDTMTGPLILNADPAAGQNGSRASTKRYVDKIRQVAALSDVALTSVADTDFLMFGGVLTVNTTTSNPIWTNGRYIVNVANSTSSDLTATRNGNSITFKIKSGLPTQLANTLTNGSYILGSPYNNSTSTTWSVDATSTNQVSTVVARDSNGDFSARKITAVVTSATSLLVNGSFYSTATTATSVSTLVARDSSGRVHGQAFVSGGADLAENYRADRNYDPGTVLEFGGSQEVTLAAKESTAVAGVVSSEPGHLMNIDCSGEYVAAVALMGRVSCKVKGKISKGDLLVSAGNGYAKAKAEPKIGSVLGKSIEDFNGDYGTVEIVVGKL